MSTCAAVAVLQRRVPDRTTDVSETAKEKEAQSEAGSSPAVSHTILNRLTIDLPTALARALTQAVAGLPKAAQLLVRRPAPGASYAFTRFPETRISEVRADDLTSVAHSFDLVVDGGELSHAGLVMQLSRYRWDALGRSEEALRAVAALFALVKPGGRLLVHVEGEPEDYLVGYLAAFPVDVHELQSSSHVYECTTNSAVGAAALEAVLAREVFDERSHWRYAHTLNAALPGDSLSILDVGGGDGHMAEWWAASGHKISVLEVDEAEAAAAERRLGADRVTLHDGVSRWPFADGSFDICSLLFVLHHIAAKGAVERTLAEAARVSRRQVIVMEDQPRAAASQCMCKLAAAVTAEHFRPFGQDPGIYMQFIRPDGVWRALFANAGMRVADAKLIPGTLQHPVPHTLYNLIAGD